MCIITRTSKSSISTGKVIGLCELIAYHLDAPCELFTPQQVKCASGFGGSADKEMILRVSSRLFCQKITSHHVADASFGRLGGMFASSVSKNVFSVNGN